MVRGRSRSPVPRTPVRSPSQVMDHVCGCTVARLGKYTYVCTGDVGATRFPFSCKGTMVAFSRVVSALKVRSTGPLDVVMGVDVSARGGPPDCNRPGVYVMTFASRGVFGSGKGSSGTGPAASAPEASANTCCVCRTCGSTLTTYSVPPPVLTMA